MNPVDPYSTLGLGRDASPDDIKKAFRRLALRYHPDHNPGDATAEQRFKEVTQAYELLSDPVRRFQFDKFGFSRASGPSWNADPGDLREVFDRLMNEAFGSNPFKDFRPWRTQDAGPTGEDLRYSITVSLQQVASGTTRELSFTRKVTCAECNGSGADGRSERVLCTHCGGSGESRRRTLLRRGGRCKHCKGEGYVAAARCSSCAGDGRTPVEAAVRVKVPAGVESGQRLKVKAMGNEGLDDTGDLFVVVDVMDHAYFQRDKRNVYCRLPVTFTDLALGAELPVPTLDDRAVVRIPAGTQPDQVLTLKGHGLPGPRGGRRGDQRVRLVLEIPRVLDPEARENLERLAGAATPEPTPLRRQVLDLLDEMG